MTWPWLGVSGRKNYITFHVSLHMIWGYLGPISPNCPNTQIPIGRYNWTLRWLWHKSKTSFDIKWGAEVFGFLFVCPCAWFGVFGPSFPKLPHYLSTWETGITQPAEALDTRVKSHLMWNKKLKTLLWIAFCVSLHVIWGIQPQFPQIKICIWNVVLKTLY